MSALKDNQRPPLDYVPRGGWKSQDDQRPPRGYVPRGGWNPAFSQKDKTSCTELFEHIRPIHGEVIAEMMSQMIMFKRKYHLKYSEEQEQKLAAVLGIKATHSLGRSINPRMVMKNSAV